MPVDAAIRALEVAGLGPVEHRDEGLSTRVRQPRSWSVLIYPGEFTSHRRAGARARDRAVTAAGRGELLWPHADGHADSQRRRVLPVDRRTNRTPQRPGRSAGSRSPGVERRGSAGLADRVRVGRRRKLPRW